MHPQYGLIFDVDGVVADTESVNARAGIRVFEDMFNIHGVRREDFEAGLGRGAEEYIKAAAQVHSVELTDDQVAAATMARQENFLKVLSEEPLDPFPGVLDLMTGALNDDRFSVAIATSSTRAKSEAVLKSARIPYGQMAYITGDDVKSKKPDPELFMVAACAIDVPNDQCVVIEDAPNGVEAAHAAGCKCIAVTNSASATALSSADMVVSSLAEVELERVATLV